MHGDGTQKSALIQNLQDAGCPQAVIEHFMESYGDGDTPEQIRILSRHRKGLLARVHEEQNRLECLDHLLFRLKRKG